LLIDKQGKINFGFFLEEAGIAGVTEADGGEGGVFFAKSLLVFAQLRDLFTAKNSAVVTQEDEDGGIRFPDRAEADGVAEGIGKGDAS
jgi:hypothetical protein